MYWAKNSSNVLMSSSLTKKIVSITNVCVGLIGVMIRGWVQGVSQGRGRASNVQHGSRRGFAFMRQRLLLEVNIFFTDIMYCIIKYSYCILSPLQGKNKPDEGAMMNVHLFLAC